MANMNTPPDRARVRLPGISSRAYEHPADRSALVAMRKLTGFDVLLRRLASLFSDRSLRLLFLASSVRASQEQFPHLCHDRRSHDRPATDPRRSGPRPGSAAQRPRASRGGRVAGK